MLPEVLTQFYIGTSKEIEEIRVVQMTTWERDFGPVRLTNWASDPEVGSDRECRPPKDQIGNTYLFYFNYLTI